MSLASAVAQPSRVPSPAPSPRPAQPRTQTASVALLRSYLSKLMRIGIADGRVFIGMFACIDKDRNLVLVNTEEFRVDESQAQQSPSNGGRYVGMVMIPWKHVVSAEVEGDDDLYT